MEYSGLVEAIKQDDDKEINRLLKSLIPQLITYLQIQLNAAKQDAEDCAQQAFLISFEAVREGTIEQPDHIFSFLITTCRNNYLNRMNRQKRTNYDDFSRNHGSRPAQLLSLLNSEKRAILKQCLKQLSDGYKTFIDYWFSHPESGAEAAATHFGISVNNAWTRKHRVISKLSECCQKKSKI